MSATAEHELSEALVLGRYRLGRRLGAGGFGTVHEAVDEVLDRWVAVKVIPAEGSTPARARREAVAAARLEHPGIVAIFDAGEEDGARYLVSELVDGRTLAQLQAAGELTDRDALRVGLALCDALAHAHERGVVHRDVKPQNVLVPDRPRTWRGAAKLADFGIATLAGDDALTRTGDVVGTFAYMAPEQAQGKRVDARADLYALALVVYEALAHTNPVRGASPADTARRVGRPVPSLAKHRRDLPAGLVAAIDTALNTTPGGRGSLEELGDALEDALLDVADAGGTVARHPAERRSLRLPQHLPRGSARLLGAAGAGVIAAAVPALLGPSAQLPWPLAAAAAAALTLLAPRVGWLLAMLALTAALAVPENGTAATGTALVALAGLAGAPLLLWRHPRAWSVPALAPLLGPLGLAAAFPALAGRAYGAFQRAALGALGAWWLLLAESLATRPLLLGPPDGARTGGAARATASLAAEAIGATISTGAVAIVAIWAVAAMVLPWLVRGRVLAADLVAATVWAAALGSATSVLATALGLPEPRGLVAATVLAGAVAVAAPRYSYPDDDETVE